MTVQFAREVDIPRILDMGETFHGSADAGPYDRDAAEKYLRHLMLFGAVFVTRRGFIAGMAVPNPGDAGVTAHEVFWWAEDGHGKDLADAFMDWARLKGCNAVEFSFPVERAGVGKVLTRWGFTPQTQVMRKEIACV